MEYKSTIISLNKKLIQLPVDDNEKCSHLPRSVDKPKCVRECSLIFSCNPDILTEFHGIPMYESVLGERNDRNLSMQYRLFECQDFCIHFHILERAYQRSIHRLHQFLQMQKGPWHGMEMFLAFHQYQQTCKCHKLIIRYVNEIAFNFI